MPLEATSAPAIAAPFNRKEHLQAASSQLLTVPSTALAVATLLLLLLLRLAVLEAPTLAAAGGALWSYSPP